MVIAGHTQIPMNSTGMPASLFRKLPFVRYGWTGVDLFFVLSGYLIGRQLWRELGIDQSDSNWSIHGAARLAYLAALFRRPRFHGAGARSRPIRILGLVSQRDLYCQLRWSPSGAWRLVIVH